MKRFKIYDLRITTKSQALLMNGTKKFLHALLNIKSYILNLALLPTYWVLVKIPGYRKLPILAQRGIATLLTLMVLTSSAYSYLYLLPEKASAAWFDDSYSYRQRVDITNGGSNQTDYQVSITLNTSTLITNGKMQSDCDDLRVTDINGRLLPHWIETGTNACNTTTTAIWTKVPSITTSGAAVYLYYGNSSASNRESGDQTFLFFDDFSTGNMNKWTNTSGTITVTGGTATFAAGAYAANTNFNVTTQANVAMEGRSKVSGTNGRANFGTAPSGQFGLQEMGAGSWTTGFNHLWYSNGNTFQETGNGTHTETSWFAYTTNWNRLSLKWLNATSVAFVSEGNTATKATNPPSSGGTAFYPHINAFDVITQEVDFVFFRKFTATEPSVASPTNEEKAPSPVAYWKFDEGQGLVAQNSQYKSNGTTTNLITNPSFETNTTGWSALGSFPSSFAISNEKSVHGSYSAKAVFSGSTLAGFTTTFAVTSGTAYTVSAYINVSSFTSASLQMDIIHPNATETDVSPVNFTSTTGGWARYSGTFTPATSGTATVRFFGDATPTLTAYIDGVQAEAASIRTNYCDGSLTGNGTRSWSGTAHNSTSTCSIGTDASFGVVTTASTGPTWQDESQCVSGKCLLFDGTNDYVAASDHPNFDFSSSAAFTLTAWIRTPGNSTSGNILSQYNGGVLAGVKFFVNSGATTLQYHDGSGLNVTTTGTVGDNKWHHVAYVQASNSDHKIYIDGVLDVSSGSTGITPNSTYPMQIGASLSSSSPNEFFKGSIDEPKVYNFALTAAEIKAHYVSKAGDGGSVLGSTNTEPLSEGLVGYWKMDEASANTCTGGTNDSCDSSGNGNNAAWNGSATAATGKFGNGVTFNDSTDYLTVTSSTSLQISDKITISVWAYWTGSGTTVDFITAKGGEHYEIHTGGGGGSNGLRWIPRAGVYIDTGANDFPSNQWNHIVATYDSATNSGKVYVNGIDTAATQTGTGSLQTDSTDFIIGRRADTSFPYGGRMDEVRVYNRFFTPAEVSQLYNFAPGPLLHYKFDEQSSSSISDSSSSGNNGTPNGTPAFTAGKYGAALDNNGSPNYISKSSASAFDFDGKNFTVEAWIKPDNATGDVEAGIVCFSSGSGGTSPWCLVTDNDDYVFYTDSDGLWPWTDGAATSDDVTTEWAHVAGVYTSGSSLQIYVNGVLKATDSSIASSDLYNPASPVIWVGRGQDHGYFNGLIDDVRVYNYARTSKQIVEDMNAGHPAPGSPVGSPIGHWRFDEGADNTCSGGTNDVCNSGSQGSTLNGAQSNMAVPATSTSGWTQQGKFGKALNFDGSNDFVTVSHNTAMNPGTGDFSVSYWVKSSAATRGGVAKVTGDTTCFGCEAYHGWSLIVTSNGQAYANIGTSSTNVRGVSPINIATTGQWVYLTMTWNASSQTIKLYQNGVLKASDSTGSGTVGDVSYGGDLKIGCLSSNHCETSNIITGAIDEVKIYRSELTTDQIKQDMNQGQTLVLGSTSDNSSYEKNSANQEYCVPGDSTSCAVPRITWDLDEMTGSTAYDESGNGYNGTLKNSPTWSVGKTNGGLTLDGTNDHIDGPAGVISATGTFEIWVKLNDTTDRYLYAFDTGPDQSPGCVGQYGYFNSSSQFTANNYDGAPGFVTITSTTTFTTNTWYHIAVVTQSGTNNFKLYVNGKLEAQGTTASINAFGQFTIGNHHADCVQATDDSSNPIDGSIDHVKYFAYNRTPAQIAWDYNSGGPVGHWRFDECQGTTANDSSGKSNSATITIGGSGTYTSAGTCASGTSSHAWAGGVAGAGKRNHALSFDGTDDYAQTSTTAIGTGAFTVATWFKYTGGNYLFWQQETQLWINGSNISGRMYNGSSSSTTTTSSSVSTGTWYHVVMVYNGVQVFLYLNGVRDGTATAASGDVVSGAAYFGRDEVAGWLNGQIDDMRVYNYALTATQVKSLMNEGAVRYGPVTGAP